MLNLFAISGILTAVTSISMACFMFMSGRILLNRLWGVYCLTVFLWGLGVYLIATTSNPIMALFYWRIVHIAVIFIPILFTHFVFEFLEVKDRLILFVIYSLGVFFLFSDLYGIAFISGVHYVFGQFYYIYPVTPLYAFYTVFFVLLVVYSHMLLWHAYKATENKIKRTRILYFFLGVLISFLGGSTSFLPVYGIDLYPIGNMTTFIYPLVISYAIMRHHLFHIRTATAQVAMFVMWMFMFIRLFFSQTFQDFILNLLMLAAGIVVGIVLIRSVMKEVATRDEIERLAEDLELANESLRELDKRKSEFVSIASHQLRSPLAVVKEYCTQLLDGSFGTLATESKEAIERIMQSTARLLLIIDDFLTISKIEQGKLPYSFGPVGVKAMLADIVRDMRSVVEERGLTLRFDMPASDTDAYRALADSGKVIQVVTNLIDNAVKYTPKGGLTISLKRDEQVNRIRIIVADTGIGMSEKTRQKLFQKFSRGTQAFALNRNGSGLGLYVAEQIMQAHNGRIWVESPGEGKGSTFYLELPAL